MSATKTPVEELSGRELDVAVAVEVMGWSEKEAQVEDERWRKAAPSINYSTDLEAAWDLWVELERRDSAHMDWLLDHHPWTVSLSPVGLSRAALRLVRSTNEGA